MDMDWKWTLGTIILMFVLAITGWIAAFVVILMYTLPVVMALAAIVDLNQPPKPHTHGPLIRELGHCPICNLRVD